MHKCKINAQKYFYDMESFGERLKRMRKKKGLSQEEFAVIMSKANKTVISSWELDKARPSMDEIIYMADFFQVTTDHLLRGAANILEEPSGEYVRISKDDLIKIQWEAINNQRQQLQMLKNIESLVVQP
jgi:transcriptional regulator with XRE-family HTH domain